MGLCKRAYVRGINHEMMRQGVVGYPTAKIAEEAADEIADALEEMPETTGEEGLDPEESAEIMDAIVEVANEIAEKSGSAPDEDLSKVASAVDYEAAAHAHAISVMEKAAAEFGTDVTGGPPMDENASGGMADIDAMKNPSDEIVVPQGTTHFDTSAGEVGAQREQPDPPGFAPPIDNEVSKLSAWLNKLSMEGDSSNASGDGTPGSSGGKGDGRKDLETNVAMPKQTVVRPQGTTQQTATVPVPTKPNPAASGVTQESKPTTDVEHDKGKKVAQLILSHPDRDAIIAKLAASDELPDFLKKKDDKEDKEDKEDKDEKSESKAEEKKEEAKKEESEKEAALLDALSKVALS